VPVLHRQQRRRVSCGIFYSRGGWPLTAAFAVALLAVAMASAVSLRR